MAHVERTPAGHQPAVTPTPPRSNPALHGELSRRGLRCELIGHGVVPRLRVYPRGDTGGTEEFDNNIVAVPLGGGWFYCWPWAEPIGPVTAPGRQPRPSSPTWASAARTARKPASCH